MIPAWTGAGLHRLALASCLPVAAVLFALAVPAPSASAAGLVPCSTAPTGPIVTLDGEATLESRRPGRKMLRRAGVRRTLIRPANSATGRPAFPVRKVRFGKVSRVWLKGGLRFRRGKRTVAARGLLAFVPKNRKRPVRVTARLGGRNLLLFRATGGHRVIRAGRGELDQINAVSRLGGRAVRRLNRRLGLLRLPKHRRLSTRVRLDRFDLNATYFKVKPDDPVAETPVEPPVAVEPDGAVPLGTASIQWELRDSWIDYINTGQAPKVGGGTVPGLPREPKDLVYDYTFPFASGWTAAGTGTESDSTLIKGAGSLAFRYCEHTINFKVSEPEIELSDDGHSRMIFRVDGLDGTAFPDQRAVMVKLRPSKVTPTTTETGGVVTETWERIPGYIPAEGTGIFANFYPAYNPALYGTLPQKDRPDRFGFLTVSYTYPAPGP